MEDLIFEVKRKLAHIGTVVYVIIYYFVMQYFSQRTALLMLALIFTLLVFLEFMKMKYHKKIPFFNWVYRENEKNTLSGSIYLIIGVIIAFAIFDFNIAATAILMMIFGDAASAVMGRIGKHKIHNLKASWEGVISEFLVDFAVGFIFLNNIPIILVMALVATFVETALKPVDDNLSVPVIAGFAGQAMIIIFRIFNLV